MTEENSEPKIIVDEDWKSQVEQEKAQLHQQATRQPEPEAEMDLPPASFVTLLSMLGAQAMSGLGLIPDPATGEPAVNRPLAKHCIDTLAILQEKTKGNLTEDEAGHIRDALHQLRMVYVSMGKAPASGSGNTGSTIELP